MKILFLGTPEFAVASLDALVNSKNHKVVGVVTQPDRAVKHGKTEPCAVKQYALSHGLRVFQPEKIRNELKWLRSFGADIAVTAAFGQILTREVLDTFPCGVINVHASLLPLYRGASPIASAIADGASETGVTIMRTETGIDTGDILAQKKTEIAEDETAGSLTERLSALGAQLLIEVLDGFDGIVPVKQDENLATRCRIIKKEEAFIDFDASAKTVSNKIRALSPTPCAKTVISGETYKIYLASVFDSCNSLGVPGEIIRCDKELVIACREGAISVERIQAPSKRALDISEFLRGKKFALGSICEKFRQ